MSNPLVAVELREPSPPPAGFPSNRPLQLLILGLGELLVALIGYTVYALSCGAVKAHQALAFRNAGDVIEFERHLGLFDEQALQGLVLTHGWLLQALNDVYMWGHLPLIMATAVWLFWCHRDRYRLYRNAVLISGGLALIVFYSFPLAPPRLVPSLHIQDTAAMVSAVYNTVEPKVFFNPYAAMPSMHIGWDLLMGLALATCSSVALFRWFGWLLPAAMLLAVVLTGNHYIVDGLAGAVVGLLGLVGALGLEHLRVGYGITGAGLEHTQSLQED